jgi:hypothetical protein
LKPHMIVASVPLVHDPNHDGWLNTHHIPIISP